MFNAGRNKIIKSVFYLGWRMIYIK